MHTDTYTQQAKVHTTPTISSMCVLGGAHVGLYCVRVVVHTHRRGHLERRVLWCVLPRSQIAQKIVLCTARAGNCVHLRV